MAGGQARLGKPDQPEVGLEPRLAATIDHQAPGDQRGETEHLLAVLPCLDLEQVGRDRPVGRSHGPDARRGRDLVERLGPRTRRAVDGSVPARLVRDADLLDRVRRLHQELVAGIPCRIIPSRLGRAARRLLLLLLRLGLRTAGREHREREDRGGGAKVDAEPRHRRAL
jgi:hypothetical protein